MVNYWSCHGAWQGKRRSGKWVRLLFYLLLLPLLHKGTVSIADSVALQNKGWSNRQSESGCSEKIQRVWQKLVIQEEALSVQLKDPVVARTQEKYRIRICCGCGFKVITKACVLAVVVLLLMLSGDVELNPGPALVLNVRNVVDVLHEAEFADDDWELLGLQLFIQHSALLKIRASHHGSAARCMVATIAQWPQSDLEASWEKLAEAVAKVEGYGEATAAIVRHKAGIGIEPMDQDSGFEKAMKEGFVTIRVTKCAISGPPGAGKSNLRSLILKEERPEKYHSTPVATEATHATPDFFPSFQEDMVEAGQDDWIIVDNAKMKQFMVSWLEAPKYQMVVQDNTQTKTSEENETAGQATRQLSNPIEIEVRIRKELQQLRKNPHHKPDRLAIMRFVYLVDTGGQPQFHEVLPMFVRNTSVNMFVFKLSEKLSDCPIFKYYINGESYCEPKELQFTNRELIEHSARSVFSCSQSREIKHVKRKPTHPDIALVGTFKDEYEEDSETMEEKEKILMQCLDPCIKRNGIIHASNEMVIFDIDGSETGWSNNDTMLRSLREKIIRSDTWMEIDVPIRWFAFQLELKDHAKRNNLDFVMLTVCYEIGKQLDMNREDVDQVLLFLDEVNIILYYPNILPNVVFCNPQFLLQKVTEIIVASFKSHNAPRFIWYQDFHRQGIFSTKLISAFQAGYKGGEFSQNELLLLLQELLIIAKVEEDNYFMPCVLPVEQLNSDARRKLIAESDFAPLFFSFSGYSPRGLYCALIVYLTSQSRAGSDTWNITSTYCDLVQKRNLIEFHMQTSTKDSIGTVLIEDMPSFVVVYAFGCEPKYCQKIRLTVYTAVLHATEKLHYDHNKIECKVGFLCDGSCGKEPEHAAFVQSDGKVKCAKNPRIKSKPLTKEQQPWFDAGTSSSQTKDENPALQKKPSSRNFMNYVAAAVDPASWKNFAIQLELKTTDIGRIAQEQRGNINNCFMKVFELWEHSASRPHTWATIIDALRHVGEIRVATEIETKISSQPAASSENIHSGGDPSDPP